MKRKTIQLEVIRRDDGYIILKFGAGCYVGVKDIIQNSALLSCLECELDEDDIRAQHEQHIKNTEGGKLSA